jgi:sigma-E factor negative regulatory protein RseB
MTVRSAQVLPGAHDPVAHLVFTDGLASVSVFVESRSADVPRDQPALSGVANVGSASAFSTVIDGHKVTAVGEVPPATVRFIASSVKRSEAPLAVGATGH